ncbi:MAG: 1,4-dihydroxy-2-naphthoate polyprenyltransferase [Lentimicrobiaceae bacterium]|nr:1,4-dihydroxy-2-naphthoate polyprenyltransferase [Lentimicrobiaceae bacterium]
MKNRSVVAWVHAARPRTLPLAFSSTLMGSFVAWNDHKFKWPVFVLALTTTLFLQVLSNLANDYGDTVNGADNHQRVGPARSVQSGAISLKNMKIAVIIVSILALLSGIALIGMGVGFYPSVDWLMFLVLGIAALISAIVYTAGSRPYGYKGLGDLFVFLFFGLTGVVGTYYLHTGYIPPSSWLPAASVGLLSTAVLNVNNMRDVKGDTSSGKRTLVVAMGSRWAHKYHAFLVIGALVALMVYTLLRYKHAGQFIYLVMVFYFGKHLNVVFNNTEPAALDPQLRILAIGTFFTVLFFGFSLML